MQASSRQQSHIERRPPAELAGLVSSVWIQHVVVGQCMRLFPGNGPDIALDLVDSRAFPKGITMQVYRPTGRPQYATAPT